jgi:hypothetical protein
VLIGAFAVTAAFLGLFFIRLCRVTDDVFGADLNEGSVDELTFGLGMAAPLADGMAVVELAFGFDGDGSFVLASTRPGLDGVISELEGGVVLSVVWA